MRRGVWANRKVVIAVPRSDVMVRTSLAMLPTRVTIASLIGAPPALSSRCVDGDERAHIRCAGATGGRASVDGRDVPGPAVEDRPAAAVSPSQPWRPTRTT